MIANYEDRPDGQISARYESMKVDQGLAAPKQLTHPDVVAMIGIVSAVFVLQKRRAEGVSIGSIGDRRYGERQFHPLWLEYSVGGYEGDALTLVLEAPRQQGARERRAMNCGLLCKPVEGALPN